MSDEHLGASLPLTPPVSPKRRTRFSWIAWPAAAVIVTAGLTACTATPESVPAANPGTVPAVADVADVATSVALPGVGADHVVPVSSTQAAAVAVTDGAPTATLAKLDTLPIKGRAPKTGYSRDQFGSAWADDVTVAGGHNGCDTRNDILRRDLTAITTKPGTRDCTVLTGTLHDPYTGKTIAFTRGQNTSAAVQIDHVVALSNAWQTGAQQLSAEQRQNLANDPRNLLAVDGPTNTQKSDGDAATWLPPNKSFRCEYVTKQVEVKSIYGLWVTQAEHDAIVRVLQNCGAAATPVTTAQAPAVQQTFDAPPPPPATPVPAVTTAPPAPVGQAAVAPSGSDVYYKNCAAARAAGAAPLHRSDPGYSSKLDRDGDGIACE